MAVALSKKGVFFTFIALLMVSAFLVVVTFQQQHLSAERMPVEISRVIVADNYVKSLNHIYIDRAIRTSAYNALVALAIRINKTRNFTSSLEQLGCDFENAMVSGRIVNASLIEDTPDLWFQTDFLATVAEVGEVSFGGDKGVAQSFYTDADVWISSVILWLKGSDGDGVYLELRRSRCDQPSTLLANTTIWVPGSGWSEVMALFPRTLLKKGEYFLVLSSDAPEDGVSSKTASYDEGKLYSARGQLMPTIDEVNNVSIVGEHCLNERLERIENVSWEALHIRTAFKRVSITSKLYQSNKTGPWQVGVNLSVEFDVDAMLASWNTSDVIETVFSIEGLTDPFYSYHSKGLVMNTIRMADVDAWDVDALYWHIENITYRANPSAPSFLMRFVNDTEASACCGIEAPINPLRFKFAAGEDYNKVYIDYCFYSWRCAPDVEGRIWNITGISYYDDPEHPEWAANRFPAFKIDTPHAKDFNLLDEIK